MRTPRRRDYKLFEESTRIAADQPMAEAITDQGVKVHQEATRKEATRKEVRPANSSVLNVYVKHSMQRRQLKWMNEYNQQAIRFSRR